MHGSSRADLGIIVSRSYGLARPPTKCPKEKESHQYRESRGQDFVDSLLSG